MYYLFVGFIDIKHHLVVEIRVYLEVEIRAYLEVEIRDINYVLPLCGFYRYKASFGSRNSGCLLFSPTQMPSPAAPLADQNLYKEKN